MKKKYFLILIYILSSLFIFAQENDFKDGTVWGVNFNWGGSGPWYYEICGDTLFQGVSLKKLYIQSNPFPSVIDDGYMGAIYTTDSDDKVWIIRPGNVTPTLLYDFTLEVGDTFVGYNVSLINYGIQPLTVQSIYYETIHGIERKVIQFENVSSYSGERWIKGIGSTKGFLERGDHYVSDIFCHLHCCVRNDSPLYSFSGYCTFDEVDFQCFSVPTQFIEQSSISLFPNPTQNFIKIEFSSLHISEKKEIRIFDSLGRLIHSEITQNQNGKNIPLHSLDSGIYFLSVRNSNGIIFSEKIIKY